MYEIWALSNICNKSDDEVLAMDDVLALKYLLAKNKDISFNNKLNELINSTK